MLNTDLADAASQYGTDRRAAHELLPRMSNREAGQEHLHIPLQQSMQTNCCYPIWSYISNADWYRSFIWLKQNTVQNTTKSSQVPNMLLQPLAQRAPVLKASSDHSRFHPNRKFLVHTSKHIKVMSAWAVSLCVFCTFFSSPKSFIRTVSKIPYHYGVWSKQ